MLRDLERARTERNNERVIAEACKDQNLPLPSYGSDPADGRQLRGIPAIGRNVAGAIPGTRPDHMAA